MFGANAMATTTIRTATPDDIKQIHRWLQEEERMGVQGNFLCNWEVISNQYEDQDVVVFIPKGDTVPRGFLTAGLSVSSILQVQSQFRGQGIARQLVEYALARCEKDNDFQLLLECAPITSIPFCSTWVLHVSGKGRMSIGYSMLRGRLRPRLPRPTYKSIFIHKPASMTIRRRPSAPFLQLLCGVILEMYNSVKELRSSPQSIPRPAML